MGSAKRNYRHFRHQSVSSEHMEHLEARTLLSSPSLLESGTIGAMAMVGSNAYFIKSDARHGSELWVSDGTRSGTRMVKETVPGPGDAEIRDMAEFQGRLFFSAKNALWTSDGTPDGTVRIASFASGSDPGQPSYRPSSLTVSGDQLYFVVYDAQRYWPDRYETGVLWRSDGTEAGTMPVPNAPEVSFRSNYIFRALTDVDGTLFFVGYDAAHGRELWKTDGTSKGTTIIADIAPGLASSYPTAMTNAGGTLYFLANAKGTGVALWRSDGTAGGTYSLKMLLNRAKGALGGGSWFYPPMAAVGKTIYFVANRRDTGMELWKSNGTAKGTTIVKDIEPGPYVPYEDPFSGQDPFLPSSQNSSYPRNLTAVNGILYFTAENTRTGRQLWKTDGTEAGTRIVKRIGRYGKIPGGFVWKGGGGGDLTDVNGTLYFASADSWKPFSFFEDGHYILRGAGAGSLWASDGTAAGTFRVVPSRSFFGVRISGLAGGKLFIQTSDTNGFDRLWSFQPPAAPTLVIKGTVGDDRIDVAASNDSVTVTKNGKKTQYPIENVRSVFIRGFGGDDRITLAGNVPAATIFGEAGNDTILGGNANDEIDGGMGDDSLSGGDGDDIIVGRAGRDWLGGDSGNDSLFARAHDADFLDGGDGEDKARMDEADQHGGVEEILK